MKEEEIRTILQAILWDYRIDPLDFYELALGRKKRIGWFSRDRALIRMLERLSWYDLIQLFSLNELKDILKPELIAQLRFPELRRRYELARKVLRGELVSFSGWSPESRENTRHSLLSHRWYRAQ